MSRLGAGLLAFALVAAACSANRESVASCTEPAAEPVTHRYAEIDGVAAALTSLDVYAPAEAADCPVLIWVHGGGWELGDKQTRATLVKARHFNAAGFVFVSVNYRLASPENDVRWPDFGIDVATAVSWVIENGPEIGVDSNRVSIIGHSSGAHLASIVGINPDLLAASGNERAEVSCVVSLDSVTHDLTDEPRWETTIIEQAFPTPEARRDGSPTLQALEHPSDGSPPRFLIVTRGRPERLGSARDLADAIIAGGGRAEVVDVTPYDHAEVNLQLGVADETVVTPVVDDFLSGCR